MIGIVSVMKHKLLPFLSVVILVSTIGCGSHVAFTGKVVYSDDGEPVPTGEVQFYTPTFVARATIREDGTFRTGSYKETDGLPPGTYGVAIVAAASSGISLIDLKYADQRTSGLTLTIEESTRNHEFRVDRASQEQIDRQQRALDAGGR